MITAIIPAKGHSEGVENKNLKKLGDKELVRYTIEAALGSKYINSIHVTTDSPEIDMITRSYTTVALDRGKRTSVLKRPEEHTMNHVQVDEVILFALRQLELIRHNCETVVVLQPTSPFRTSQHIDAAIELYTNLKSTQNIPVPKEDFDRIFRSERKRKYPDTVFGAAQSGYVYEGWGRGEYAALGHNPMQRLGRQDDDYDGAVIENGAIYVVDAKKLSQTRSFRDDIMIPFFMDEISSMEIDSALQWRAAELIIEIRNN